METLLSLIYFLSSALLLHSAAIHESPQSITINLIHPFSVHSPFYLGKNITEVQKINLLIQATEARMDHLFPTTTLNQGKYMNGSSEVDEIAAIVEYTGTYYVAEVGIGTFPTSPKGLPYYLLMDTGSHTTWVQCEGCNPCFSLTQTPNFPFQRSQSYRSIPCGHQECPTPREACYGSSCGFKARYGSSVGPSTRGTIAKETLTFSSDRLGDTESHDNIFLACGLDNQNIRFPQPNKIAGVLGLGPGGPGTSPIWSQVLKKRFSYCLTASEQTSSRLHIGEGARMVGPQVVSAPLVKGANPSLYYVGLKDIGIAGTRLRIQGLYAGGCIIDTGAPYSSLLPNAYAMVRNGFIQYFAQFGMQPYGNGSRPSDLPRFDLCFPRAPPGFRFPTMTFHFRGADLVVQPTSVFVVGENFICVALKSSDKKTMLGAYQQTQHEFSFDLEIGNRGTLFFAPNNCGAPT